MFNITNADIFFAFSSSNKTFCKVLGKNESLILGYQYFECLSIPRLDYLCRNLLKMTAVF